MSTQTGNYDGDNTGFVHKSKDGMEVKEKTPQERWKRLIVTLLTVLFLASCSRVVDGAWGFEGRIVPSAAMSPTIQPNDRVLVNKLAYLKHLPKRGDIIIFAPPAVLNSQYDYVKRVIALPGERVEIKGGTVYINDTAIEEPYILETIDYCYGPVQVPDNSLFVLGDNRGASFDSRHWSEWVTTDRVKGKVTSIYWPKDRKGTIQNPTY